MIEPLKPLTPCAKWKNDCQGKKDYDGRLLSISARYWPAGGGFHVFDGSDFRLSTHPDIKPSAAASIVLNYGEPDENGYGDSLTITRQYFEADTEAEVKSQVEAWGRARFDEIGGMLVEKYGPLG
jgi:hypothetical protein